MKMGVTVSWNANMLFNAGGRPYSKVIGPCYFRNFDRNLSQSWIKLWVTILPLSDEICLKVVMMCLCMVGAWEARNKANAGGARQTSQVLHRATMLVASDRVHAVEEEGEELSAEDREVGSATTGLVYSRWTLTVLSFLNQKRAGRASWLGTTVEERTLQDLVL